MSTPTPSAAPSIEMVPANGLDFSHLVTRWTPERINQYVDQHPRAAVQILVAELGRGVAQRDLVVRGLMAFIEKNLPLDGAFIPSADDDVNGVNGIAQWVLNRPHLVDMAMGTDANYGSSLKIVVIKKVREALGVGLKQAKDGVELAVERRKKGYVSMSELEADAQAEREAIASILGT